MILYNEVSDLLGEGRFGRVFRCTLAVGAGSTSALPTDAFRHPGGVEQ